MGIKNFIIRLIEDTDFVDDLIRRKEILSKVGLLEYRINSHIVRYLAVKDLDSESIRELKNHCSREVCGAIQEIGMLCYNRKLEVDEGDFFKHLWTLPFEDVEEEHMYTILRHPEEYFEIRSKVTYEGDIKIPDSKEIYNLHKKICKSLAKGNKDWVKCAKEFFNE